MVLSRHRGEKIVVGEGADRVVITVVDIDQGRVRLGIEARKDIPIFREEVIGRVKKEEGRG